MLRLHFTADDLLRTRFAPAPVPLLELGLAMSALQRREPSLAHWRAATYRELPAAALPMFALVTPRGTGPTFLDPVSDGLDDGLDLVRSTPDDVVLAELQRVCASDRPLTPWVRHLAGRDREAWQTLAQAVVASYQVVLERQWPRVQASHRSDIAFRHRVLLEQGLQACLAGLCAGGRWEGTVLHLPAIRDRDRRLDGRGATMIPSAFWKGDPTFCDHPDGSTLIIYPALTPLPLVDAEPDGDALAALLGRTRAAVLRALVTHRSTSELAADLGISAAAASEHAKTLRASGLVVTERAGKAVLHSSTPLGLRLLARS